MVAKGGTSRPRFALTDGKLRRLMDRDLLPPGTVVAGRFRVETLLGEGGMGEVYAAVGPHGEAVALKLLHEKAARDPEITARFRREAEIAKQISSPYVSAILDAGEDADGRLFIAFERLFGEGLDDRIKREHYLSFADVGPLVADVFEGLVAAHDAQVVHRDIKPANLFIETLRLTEKERADGVQPERTRILDFGISKRRSSGSGESSLTAADATLGSFAYMAPEQVRGSARVDGRADLYALGAVAFRCLAGRLPFEGQNALTLLALKLDREPPTLASVTGDEWPLGIERFLAKMMARDRDQRFASALAAQEAWDDLRAKMGGLSTPSPRTSDGPSPFDKTENAGTWVGD